jgi:hypothetical protein
MAIGTKGREIVHARSCPWRDRIKRKQMMYFNKPPAVLSVPGIEIEVANLTRESSRLAQYRVSLPFDQFAVTFVYDDGQNGHLWLVKG